MLRTYFDKWKKEEEGYYFEDDCHFIIASITVFFKNENQRHGLHYREEVMPYLMNTKL